ncbi:MAG TPA: di-heme oxidoredictase family protein, partial [Candidatus Dormibacteraeota bacterium]|nr:di-heme oxidoredictase family protein [Candidatus Dormibacteraeota bacterium]
FDDQTNGFVNQTQFDLDRTIFEERETIDAGLGPVYNAQSCAECHQNPVTGGISQITELRAGHFDGLLFVSHPGGSLINDRAIDPSIQERVLGGNEVRTFRTSLNVLGDGFVECIDSHTLIAISNRQPFGMRGQFIEVPVLEANNQARGGRFGWKNQHASLLSFAADAYLNEIGITSPLQPDENTSNGNSVAAFDKVPDPDSDGADVEAFARFMRATKAPPRDETLAATPGAQRGDQLFTLIGCDVCHVRSIATAPAGTVINRGAFTVPPALGGKTIHPFGDFLLHNVGTGDGIVQNGGQSTRSRVRTAPLWGLRTRVRLMHDGARLTRNQAILRHAGEAAPVIVNYRRLTAADRDALSTFLDSL